MIGREGVWVKYFSEQFAPVQVQDEKLFALTHGVACGVVGRDGVSYVSHG